MLKFQKVCIVTGTRAEYGLLRHLMHKLKAEPCFDLKLIVTGSHTVSSFGMTLQEIYNDGFEVSETVDMLLASDTKSATAMSLGLGIIGISGALSRIEPDLVILLGDRYEALAAAQSAMMLNIPIAHIHGGESTEGLIDEAIRHSITKMSHLHFVAAKKYAQRVRQLGEEIKNIHVVGATGLDNIAEIEFIEASELQRSIGLNFSNPIFLVTYHPLTLDPDPIQKVDELLHALEVFKDATVIFTGANADPNGRQIDEKIKNYCNSLPEKRVHTSNLGFRRYLSLMKIANVVIGNSSSGLVEAPSIGVPTVNIGERQKGRLRSPSVIDVDEMSNQIVCGINKALNTEMVQIAKKRENPYGEPGAAQKIVATLKNFNQSNLLMKKFYDVKEI